MTQSEQHNHHTHQPAVSLNAAFITGISLNAAYVIIEAIFGFMYNSMVAYRLMSHKPDSRHTYGYKKFSVQAALINALLLYIAVGAILVESINKLIHPVEVNGDAIAWVAAAGVIVNGVTAWLFVRDKSRDINIKGAFLHMAADTLVSIGVVVSGIVIHFTGWYVIDPAIGIVIALIIAWSTKNLLVESTRMSIDAVPESIDMYGLEKALMTVDGVDSIHHLHVWPLSTTENAMTVHAVIKDVTKLNRVISDMKFRAQQFGIGHSTIEAETAASPCNDHVMFNRD